MSQQAKDAKDKAGLKPTAKGTEGQRAGANITCIYCGHVASREALAEAEDTTRCPACMRRGAFTSPDASRSWSLARATQIFRDRPLPWSLGALFLLASSLLFVYWMDRDTLNLPPEAEEAMASLILNMEPLAGGDALAAFADEQLSWSDPQKAAQGFSERTRTGQLSLWTHGSPRRGPIRSPETIADMLSSRKEGKDDPLTMYALEGAAFVAAVLNELGTDTEVVELLDLRPNNSPWDPTARFGYFAVRVRTDKGVEVFDVFTGKQVKGAKILPLGDAALIARFMALHALYLGAIKGEERQATNLIDVATELDQSSSSVRLLSASVHLAVGLMQRGKQETEAAASLADGAVQQYRLSQVRLAEGDVEGALRILANVIDEAPRFARARITLLEAKLAKGDLDEVRRDLADLSGEALQLPAFHLLRSAYYAEREEKELAETALETFESLQSKNWQLWLQTSLTYLRLGNGSGAARAEKQALALAPPSQKAQAKKILAEVADRAPVQNDGASQFDLKQPEILAGGDTAAGSTTAGSGAPALMLGDPGSLRLRSPNSKLSLDLDELEVE